MHHSFSSFLLGSSAPSGNLMSTIVSDAAAFVQIHTINVIELPHCILRRKGVFDVELRVNANVKYGVKKFNSMIFMSLPVFIEKYVNVS